MELIECRISGIPYGQNARNQIAANEWSNTIISATERSAKVKSACIMNVTFFLPPDKFPPDFPYGNDLDNLMKRLNDALNDTIFSEAIGGDSCVISLNVTKVKTDARSEPGVRLEILPIAF